MSRTRWYKKVFEEDAGVMIVQNGHPTLGLKVGMCDEEVEQIRQGVECINCFEGLPESFPEACFLCGFPVREQQMEQFARTFKGHQPGLRTGTDWEAKADELEERAERRAFQRRMERQGVSVPSIIVPKSI